MSCRVLIVEDEIFVATDLEFLVEDLGFEPIGIAADQSSALQLAENADVALVDLNLRDGPTGIGIGRELAERHGVSVIYLTANPAQLGSGVEGTLGVLAKPASESALKQAITFAVQCHNHQPAEPPPALQRFDVRPEIQAAG
ncbi:response regulator [Devosia pacifica]|uniref:response regulator n=1 Tax=Devosia pacifica TaxID=1335967 RepID=UPI00167A7AF6|nr:response regulator [Devosia pacifica]